MFNKSEYWANRKAGKRGQGEPFNPQGPAGSGQTLGKHYFKPLTVPIKSGKINEATGQEEIVETYIPRKQRRKIIRMFLADYRKGRLPQKQEA